MAGIAGWLAGRGCGAVGGGLLDPALHHTCISEPLAKPRAWASSGVRPLFNVLLTVGRRGKGRKGETEDLTDRETERKREVEREGEREKETEQQTE